MERIVRFAMMTTIIQRFSCRVFVGIFLFFTFVFIPVFYCDKIIIEFKFAILSKLPDGMKAVAGFTYLGFTLSMP